jgi:hypothetical protein
MRAAATKAPVDTGPATRLAEEVNIGVTFLLGLAGLAVLLIDRRASSEQPRIVS